MSNQLQPQQDQERIDNYQSAPGPALTMEQAAFKWLEHMYNNRSGSMKTLTAYKTTLQEFDMFLQGKGLQLDSNARTIALCLQEWIATSKRNKPVSSSTKNQRYAILSSFYQFAMKFGACNDNPVVLCERPQRTIEHAAPALDSEYIQSCLEAIDRSAKNGKRDYALVTLALTTARRASELSGLQWKDIQVIGKQVTCTFHCKGGKVIQDLLDPVTASIVLAYIRFEYGISGIRPDNYIFPSYSNRNKRGRLSASAMCSLALKRLGISQFHVTRHSAAVGAEKSGASLAAISEQLGHSNQKTTSDYLKEKHRQKSYASQLVTRFGIKLERVEEE